MGVIAPYMGAYMGIYMGHIWGHIWPYIGVIYGSYRGSYMSIYGGGIYGSYMGAYMAIYRGLWVKVNDLHGGHVWYAKMVHKTGRFGRDPGPVGPGLVEGSHTGVGKASYVWYIGKSGCRPSLAMGAR